MPKVAGMLSKNISSFVHLFSLLPLSVRTSAKAVYADWEASFFSLNALVFCCSVHNISFYSLVIDEEHSALCYVESDTAYWFWIGPNAEMERMIKRTTDVLEKRIK